MITPIASQIFELFVKKNEQAMHHARRVNETHKKFPATHEHYKMVAEDARWCFDQEVRRSFLGIPYADYEKIRLQLLSLGYNSPATEEQSIADQVWELALSS